MRLVVEVSLAEQSTIRPTTPCDMVSVYISCFPYDTQHTPKTTGVAPKLHRKRGTEEHRLTWCRETRKTRCRRPADCVPLHNTLTPPLRSLPHTTRRYTVWRRVSQTHKALRKTGMGRRVPRMPGRSSIDEKTISRARGETASLFLHCSNLSCY